MAPLREIGRGVEIAIRLVAIRAGEDAIGQHSHHVEILEHESIVGLDELVGRLVEEMSSVTAR